jgi:endonuclease YncB( thermonuclease family)
LPLAVDRPLIAALTLALLGGCSPAGCRDRGAHSRPANPDAVAGPAAARSSQARREAPRVERAAPRPEELWGTVVRVRDGDSLVVIAGGAEVEVRLDSVDAPELVQAFGGRAKRCTADLVLGRQVRLEQKGKDKYDRHLAEIFLADGRSLNRELVSAGCAWWFRRYSRDPDLEAREMQARAARRGLWADPDPVPPWDFREAHPRGPGRNR